jgi:TolB-like protein
MKRFLFVFLLLCTAAASAPGAGDPEPKIERRQVIAVFDFECENTELGAWVANNIRMKIARRKLYVVVEPMDIATIAEENGFAASYNTSPKAVAEFASDKLGCDLAMWGRVERAGDAVIIRARLVEVTDGGPSLILDDTFTAVNRHMAGPAVKQMIRQITGEEAPHTGERPEWKKAWEQGPNLVKNPGFEEGEEHPAHWEDLNAKGYHHNMVSWVEAPADGDGKCIKFELNKAVAASYGVGYYGEPIDTSQGTRYRFSVRVLSMAPSVKIFLKHYAWFEVRGKENKGQWREVRRAPLHCHGAGKQWKTFVRDFNPRLKSHGINTADDVDEQRAEKYDPDITKVELYAYWPPGVVYFDDVVLKRLE